MKQPPKRRWKRVVGIAAVLLVLGLAITLALVYRATRQVPQFYTQALASDPTAARAAGHELERRALDLRNEVQRTGEWEAIFTAEQVNGWLAVDLVEKFPDLLPPEVSEPRVAMTNNEVQFAFRYQGGQIDTVVSLAFSVAMTEETNVVAVRVRRARAGSLPLPLTQFLDKIASTARGRNIDLRWSQIDGDPVALVRLPAENTHLTDRTLQLEAIRLEPDLARLTGRTQWKNTPSPSRSK